MCIPLILMSLSMAEAKKTSRPAPATRTKTAKKPATKGTKKPATKAPAKKTGAKSKPARATGKPARATGKPTRTAGKPTRATGTKPTRATGTKRPSTKKSPKSGATKRRPRETSPTDSVIAALAATAPTPIAAPEPPKDPSEVRRDAARELAKRVAGAGLDKKAERIEIIDISDKADYADYLVLMSGRSDRQVKAVAQGIEAALKNHGVTPTRTEGMSQGHWVIVDFGDVIVHVFIEEARRHYDFDGLWLDARRVPFDGATAPTTTTHVSADDPSAEAPHDEPHAAPHWESASERSTSQS